VTIRLSTRLLPSPTRQLVLSSLSPSASAAFVLLASTRSLSPCLPPFYRLRIAPLALPQHLGLAFSRLIAADFALIIAAPNTLPQPLRLAPLVSFSAVASTASPSLLSIRAPFFAACGCLPSCSLRTQSGRVRPNSPAWTKVRATLSLLSVRIVNAQVVLMLKSNIECLKVKTRLKCTDSLSQYIM
jgi:hypothetical protein